MKKVFFLFLSTLLLLSACGKKVQPTDLHTQAHALPNKLPNVLLWKISHDSLPHSSYLFGTVHLIEEKDFFYPKGLLTALDESEEVVFEIDMRAMNDMSQIMGMMSKITMEDDVTLEDLYSEKEYEEVKSFFAEKGLPLFFMERIKPLFLSALTSFDEVPQGNKGSMAFEMEGMKSYEMELLELSELTDKQIGGVETIEFQLSVFDAIPYKKQAEYLLESIRAAKSGNVNEEIFNLYKNQNIEAMASSIADEDSSIEDELLIKRNQNWIPIMGKMMAEKPILFAVGAGHLGGQNGVIRLLHKQGYILQPIQ